MKIDRGHQPPRLPVERPRPDGGKRDENRRRRIAQMIDCAVFTPNPDRLDHIVQMAKDLKVDGVVNYTLQFCTPYNMESHLVESTLEKTGIPLLKIETDYSMENMGQLNTRVQAFIEMIKK